ncbi:MAG TPA: phosphodiester glycosidase family protein [Tepidisphaeraceae bacterium]|jgi:exopolysaccharide biosynthesis protein|nr:phosphodiester glycosidase family protein [Tepidisphaeraceae bacterium]
MLFKTKLAAFFLLLPTLVSAAEPAKTELFPGILYSTETGENPSFSYHILTISLKNPTISLHVSPAGPDPDGDGPWQTTLQTVPKIAERDSFDIAINGDFFAPKPPNNLDDGSGLGALINRGYQVGQWARVMGAAVTGGKQWSTAAEKKPALMVMGDGRVEMAEVTTAPAGVKEAVSGSAFLVREGKPARYYKDGERNARTAIGLDRERTMLTILVADGLLNGRASGITGKELVAKMMELGCYDAIVLDGGGSTTLVMRDAASGKYRVMNHPSDGKPRAVAEVLGVVVKK